jgi:hypothetical protein
VLFFGQTSDVNHQLLYDVGLDLRTKRRHFSSAFGDYFNKRRVVLIPNFVRSQILRMECLAGPGIAAAIGAVAQVAVRFVKFGGIGLGLRYTRHSQATQKACRDEAQNKLLSHVLSNYLARRSYRISLLGSPPVRCCTSFRPEVYNIAK